MTATEGATLEARQEREDGGVAFPANPETDHSGMSLRDYFAGQVLMGLAANDAYYDETSQTSAGIAYRQADAMLRERSK